MRLFTAITLPEEVKKKLKVASDKVQKQSLRGNFSHYKNYHITLVFLGEVEKADIPGITAFMDRAAHNFPPLNLSCLSPGYFNKGKRKILYYNVGGTTNILSELQLYLYKEFYIKGLCQKQKDYTPHITFARQAQIDEIPRIEQDIAFGSGAITLMHSTRINNKLTYLPIYEAPFQGILTVDRLEGNTAVCESISGLIFNMNKDYLPKSISSGSKIRYNGLKYSFDKKETDNSFSEAKHKFNKEKEP